MATPIGYYKQSGSTRPITPSKGVNESDFREKSVTTKGITAPRRNFSRAVPMSELAHTMKQDGYLKSLNKRLRKSKEDTASDYAKKEEKKMEKRSRNIEADKNLELASQFLKRNEDLKKEQEKNIQIAKSLEERQKEIRKGNNPPPVNIEVDVNSGPTLPNDKSQKKTVVKEDKKTEVLSTPIMQPPSQSMEEPEKVTPQQSNSKPKSKLSLSEMMLLRFPAKG